MRRILPFVLVVCVVLAGCNGVFGTESDERTPTLTPVAVPTDEPTPTPVPRLAPGLTGKGVVNASALAAAHTAAFENTSFTVRQTVVYRAENGTSIRRIESTTRVADGRFRVTRRWNESTTLQQVEYYDDSERVLVATTRANDTTTYRRLSPQAVVAQRSSVLGAGSGRIETMFVAAETRVANRTDRNGTTVYRLVPAVARRETSNTATVLDRSVSVRAGVTEQGLVRNYTLTQRLSGDGADGATTIVVSARYTAIGATDVERPTWYGNALAATDATASNRNETNPRPTTAG
ncbi:MULTISPECIES: DUF7537 family lipoprotein [Halococcus]|uniref:Uncharacterized protein n=1 Tax=Halococcus salifodinae DSM 8989 TaxID=1227456 RepID=M0MY06_9EURY|nr:MULTISPECIES: hypothetical protein [Halococcus]EMA49305.1 hypothetical protein C450_17347 [Halococcus salifodinae DSM 8989]